MTPGSCPQATPSGPPSAPEDPSRTHALERRRWQVVAGGEEVRDVRAGVDMHPSHARVRRQRPLCRSVIRRVNTTRPSMSMGSAFKPTANVRLSASVGIVTSGVRYPSWLTRMGYSAARSRGRKKRPRESVRTPRVAFAEARRLRRAARGSRRRGRCPRRHASCSETRAPGMLGPDGGLRVGPPGPAGRMGGMGT